MYSFARDKHQHWPPLTITSSSEKGDILIFCNNNYRKYIAATVRTQIKSHISKTITNKYYVRKPIHLTVNCNKMNTYKMPLMFMNTL